MTTLLDEVAAQTLSEVTRLVQQRHRSAKGLILTGSAARGEAAIVPHPERTVWLSDLDMLVVVDDSANIERERVSLNQLSVDVSRDLRDQGIEVAVELKPAPHRYFRSVRPSLFGYELMACGRQLWGDRDELCAIPRFHWNEIPREDAWRLLSNRMVECLDYMADPCRLSLPAQMHVLTKQYLDLLTSLSLFSGAYAPEYRRRVAALPEVIAWLRRTDADISTSFLTEAVQTSWSFRVNPGQFQWLWTSPDADLRLALSRQGNADFCTRLPSLLTSMWRIEAAWTCGQTGPAPQRPSMNRVYGLRGLTRGWAKAFLSGGGTPSWRMARLFARGTPRALVYNCTALLLESLHTQDADTLRWVRGHLPVLIGACGTGWADLARQCVLVWNRLLRHAAA
jgi:predicted nucleotidyltransferase